MSSTLKRKFAVVGNPIAHSQSPLIHQHFAEQCGVDLSYTRELVENEPEAFHAFVDRFFQSGGKGLNVTVPFKEVAYNSCQVLSEGARRAGAVNTLSIDSKGQLSGDNTDGPGLLYHLQSLLQWPVEGSCVLLLGAGGASRGVILPLLAAKPRRLIVWNRTASKASNLVEAFQDEAERYEVQLDALTASELGDQPMTADIIINATSSGLANEVPAIPEACFSSSTQLYDMLYAKDRNSQTPFLEWGTSLGIKQRADGLGMLVSQAAYSFELWNGHFPDIKQTLSALSAKLQS